MRSEVQHCAWPASRLAELFSSLVETAGLPAAALAAKESRGDVEDAAEWIAWAAKSSGCEVERLETTLAGIETEIASAHPAILRISSSEYLAVVRSRGQKVQVLTPELSKRWLKPGQIHEAIRESAGLPEQTGVDRLLEEARIPQSRRERTIRFFLHDQLTRVPFRDCWILRPASGSTMTRWLRQASILPNGAGLVTAHTIQYLLWITSWAVMGRLSFDGHFDLGWRLGWALLLLTLVPFRLLTTWKQGQLVIGFGGLLKRRLLHGAMKLGPEEMRHSGIGQYMSQTLEAETVESLALSGGVEGALSLIELVIAGAILGSLAPVLILWLALAGFVGWRFFRKYHKWTGARLAITEHLVEAMVGQRTRLAQQSPNEWHESEDQALKTYFGLSRSLDRIGNLLTMAVPRGWLVIALLCFSPELFRSGKQPAQVAVTFGGILLAYTGFRRLTGSSADISVFFESVSRIRMLFSAAARMEPAGEPFASDRESKQVGENVIEADGVGYRYRPQGNPVLADCKLAIARGDRILLEGPSGGGKTTLASLLSGMRVPQEGLLLANGLDRHALGPARWRRKVATAPQFHENHVFTETLAFNLLMGRGDVPSESDFEEAEAICRELGLGDLLDRMPSGILQMVGEGGWQLSHGERSRVFIARALLQRSDLVILDESFGALDPENLQTAMECALNRAETLMVVAHP